jgi:hypothetical protein
MANTNFNFDFNDAGEQRSFDVIPDNTVCTVQMTIRPGNVGPGGWLTRAQNGNSEHLNCEFVVVDGPHAKRKLWARYTVNGNNHADAIEISRKTLKAMLESARGIKPKDESDAAKAARQTQGWGDFDQLRFMVRLGIEGPSGGYAAKNMIKEVITPERQAWTRPEQIQAGSPSNTGTPSTPTTPPANAIARPDWAKND